MKSLGLGVLAFGFSVLSFAAQPQELHGPPDAPVVAEVLGTKIHTRDPDEMQAIIIGKLVDRYAAEGSAPDVDTDSLDLFRINVL